jgi:hypothetical protein
MGTKSPVRARGAVTIAPSSTYRVDERAISASFELERLGMTGQCNFAAACAARRIHCVQRAVTISHPRNAHALIVANVVGIAHAADSAHGCK